MKKLELNGRKQKTERHKLKSASGNGCKWDSNPCLHQPETYSGIEVTAIFIAVAATCMPEYVSGWCGHGFESHLQPFC